MKQTRAFIKLVPTVLFILTLGLSSHGSETEYSSYDDIIRNLRGAETSARISEVEPSSFQAIKIHAGAGLTNSHVRLATPGALKSSATLRGVEAFVGIDLFSRAWSAEGAVRSYTSEPFSNTQLTLKEFDIKVVYRQEMGRPFYWRAGAGVAARYLDFSNRPPELEKKTYTTPASLLVVGVGAQMSPSFSAGLDINYKNALINDTIDRSAIDGNIRLTGSF